MFLQTYLNGYAARGKSQVGSDSIDVAGFHCASIRTPPLMSMGIYEVPALKVLKIFFGPQEGQNRAPKVPWNFT